MKVQELLTSMKNKEFNLEKRLEVKKYLPMDVKRTIAQGIIYDCTTNNGVTMKVDSVQRYLSYVRYMIIMHTNLEYADEDYDTLCSTEYEDTTLLNAIMSCFGEDAQECSRILNLMMDDCMQEMSIEFIMASFINGLTKSLGGLSDKLGNFDLTQMLPDNLKSNELSAFLQNYTK